MAADVLAPYHTRSSVAMVLTMQEKQILSSHEVGFNKPYASQVVIESTNTF